MNELGVRRRGGSDHDRIDRTGEQFVDGRRRRADPQGHLTRALRVEIAHQEFSHPGIVLQRAGVQDADSPDTDQSHAQTAHLAHLVFGPKVP